MKLRALLRHQTDARVRKQNPLRKRLAEIERAIVVEAAAMPPDVIMMGSRVCLRDVVTGERSECTLVLPPDASVAARRLSVLTQLGTALLGCRQGDEVVLKMQGTVRRLRVELLTPDPDGAAAVLLPIQPSAGPRQLKFRV
jgi:regulator of nucleoside diphosphate kinase